MGKANFLEPGADGELSSNYAEWQFGVTYTVRPEIQSPLNRGREYRILTSVRRKVGRERKFTDYTELYEQALKIAALRIADLRCADPGERAHSRVLCHGWQRMGGNDTSDLMVTFLTTGVKFPVDHDDTPVGLEPPTTEELMIPGGSGLDHIQNVNTQPIHEIYVEFDHRDPAGSSGSSMFPYGEYLPSCTGVNFEPFV